MKKERKKKAPPVRSPKLSEIKYRRDIESLVLRIKSDVSTILIPTLRQLESEYVSDGYARTLQEVFERLKNSYIDIDRNAQIIASSFITNTTQVNKARFYKSIENAIGINMHSVVQSEKLDNILVSKTRENVSLIKSIPEEYFKKIEGIVFRGTIVGSDATSMISQIVKIGHSTTKRARLIARDQTAKLNSALNQERQKNLGIEEYIWRTASDDRVRDNHKSKNGKVFRWDKPPKDTGHPGEDIQCRCVAQPIIKI